MERRTDRSFPHGKHVGGTSRDPRLRFADAVFAARHVASRLSHPLRRDRGIRAAFRRRIFASAPGDALQGSGVPHPAARPIVDLHVLGAGRRGRCRRPARTGVDGAPFHNRLSLLLQLSARRGTLPPDADRLFILRVGADHRLRDRAGLRVR